ncbi:MAG TPA: hypothetical protein VMK53_00995 [Gemmatimonadales bacterium]|nr:hypothetical protein [Gemmatimonadales bacterium]
MTYTFKLSRRLASIHELRILATLALAMVLLLGGCADGLLTEPAPRKPVPPPTAPAPVPGWLNLHFTTPYANDGAVQLTVVGGVIDEIQLQPQFAGYAGVATGSARVLVTGQIASGTVARIRVPDINKVSGYQALIGQVAERGNYALRSSTLGYRAEVVK